MGFKYGYGVHESDYDMAGSGTSTTFSPESARIDRELTLTAHRFAPSFGVSVKPTKSLTLGASVEAGFITGGVDKEDVLFDSIAIVPAFLNTHSEVLKSGDLSGWDIKAGLDVTYDVSDKLSFPCFVNFRYGHEKWDVDGTATGIFFPFMPLELAAMPGPVAYENENTWWDVAAGVGAKFTFGGMDMKATAAYIHVNLENDYDRDNVNTFAFIVPVGAVSAFDESVVETRDVISLGIAAKKDFSPALTGEVGLRYDLGWGHMDLDRAFLPGFDLIGTVPLMDFSYSGTDVYQNLTLSTKARFSPTERLTLSLGANVTFPIDRLDYDMEGNVSGIDGSIPILVPRLLFDGPADLGCDTTDWQYGGFLSLSYKIGVPKPVPPAAAPEAPTVSPQLTPMSKN
jgi:hypothetical protein